MKEGIFIFRENNFVQKWIPDQISIGAVSNDQEGAIDEDILADIYLSYRGAVGIREDCVTLRHAGVQYLDGYTVW
jgi:hypothetical protein